MSIKGVQNLLWGGMQAMNLQAQRAADLPVLEKGSYPLKMHGHLSCKRH